MGEGTSFYETTYSTVGTDVQTRVRTETYDEDLGQAGWLHASEAGEFASWLGSDVRSLLDVAWPSGDCRGGYSTPASRTGSSCSPMRTENRPPGRVEKNWRLAGLHPPVERSCSIEQP